MNKYSQQSLRVRDDIHKDLRVLFDFILPKYDHSLVTGFRGEAEQNMAFYAKPQLSKKKWPTSKHNTLPTRAVDADPYPKPTGKNAIYKYIEFAGFVTGVAYVLWRLGEINSRIRHLGWTDLNDWHHFERY